MAKLYAEITSDKGGRVVGKGGNKEIVIKLAVGNNQDEYTIVHKANSLLVYDSDYNVLLGTGEHMLKTENKIIGQLKS